MDIIDQFLKAAGKETAVEKTDKNNFFPFWLRGKWKAKSKSKDKASDKTKDKDKPKDKVKKAMDRWNRRVSDSDPMAILVVAEELIDSLIGNQVSKEKMDEESCEVLCIYAAYLRALYLIHHQNHLETAGYEHHLLFQRLYESAQEMADDAGEKVVGLCGELVHQEFVGKFAEQFMVEDKTPIELLKSSLAAEKGFQSMAQNVYTILKEKDCLTLGLDDMIMSQASDGESHIYLLTQAIKGIVSTETSV
jgi:DNA-binding ferritin-like protein